MPYNHAFSIGKSQGGGRKGIRPEREVQRSKREIRVWTIHLSSISSGRVRQDVEHSAKFIENPIHVPPRIHQE